MPVQKVKKKKLNYAKPPKKKRKNLMAEIMANAESLPDRPKELEPRQKLFVKEYLVDCNGTQAAIRAGYSAKTAGEQAPRLLANVRIKEAVQNGLKEKYHRFDLTAERVLLEIHRLANYDITKAYDKDGNLLPLHEMPEDVRRAISSVETESVMRDNKDPTDPEADKTMVTVKKIKFADKRGHLDLLAKHFKLLVDKIELTGKDGAPIEVKSELKISLEERIKLLKDEE